MLTSSVAMGQATVPLAAARTGHFYLAQTGHFHVAATVAMSDNKHSVNCGDSSSAPPAVEVGGALNKLELDATTLALPRRAAEPWLRAAGVRDDGHGVARDTWLPVMTRMQTMQLRPHVPLLLLSLVGAVVLDVERARRGVSVYVRRRACPAR
jgi:hypothetical protein